MHRIYKTSANICVCFLMVSFLFLPKDPRFKLYPNGTLRINNVEVYGGQMYVCETKNVGGRLTAQARVIVLGELQTTLLINNHNTLLAEQVILVIYYTDGKMMHYE